MNDKLKNALKYAFFLGLGIFLVWWPLHNFSDEAKTKMIAALKEAEYIWLVFSVLFALASHVSRAMRWQMMLEPVDKRPTFANSFLAIMIAYLANLAFPRLGEVTRCGLIRQYEGVAFDKAFGTVITERVIDVIMLFSLTALVVLTQLPILGSFFMEKVFTPLLAKFSFITNAGIYAYLFGFIALIVLAEVLWLIRKYGKQSPIYAKIVGLLKGVWDGIISVKDVRSVPIFIAHSLFIWFMYFCMIAVCFKTTDFTSDLGFSVSLAILCFGSFAIIATQGGIGAYPLIVAAILGLYGVEYELGFAFGWIVWTNQTLMILVVGFISLILLPRINSGKKIENPNVESLEKSAS